MQATYGVPTFRILRGSSARRAFNRPPFRGRSRAVLRRAANLLLSTGRPAWAVTLLVVWEPLVAGTYGDSLLLSTRRA